MELIIHCQTSTVVEVEAKWNTVAKWNTGNGGIHVILSYPSNLVKSAYLRVIMHSNYNKKYVFCCDFAAKVSLAYNKDY